MKSCLWIVFFVTLLAGTKTQDFELSDAFDDDPTPAPKDPVKPKDPSLAPEPKKPAVVPPKEGGADDFDLMDAFGPDPVPGKPAIVPPKDGGTGGGSFGDKDLFDLSEGGDGGYKPDPGQGGGGADNADNADQSQEAGPGQIAGIASAIGVAILGAASSYFAYQKKKLCFKIQGGVDPESGKDAQGVQSDPQVMSNLLRSS
ncbi:CD99 molecule isoform X2 [Esox lucius]|uniref:CD99 molecule isoform X2 n=1 Tax=Esox lucius TaxID=8010 RepID=UPI001476CCD0|nr:CD99 molecule isoform X2 [Esox lucius]